MIGGAFFYPKLIFDPVMSVQRSNFGKINNFSNFTVNLIKTMNRSDLTLSPTCSSFNPEQNGALL